MKVCSEEALNLGSDVLLCMSDGKLFHRIIEREKKLVSVDDFFYSRDGIQIFSKIITTVGRELWQKLCQIRRGQVRLDLEEQHQCVIIKSLLQLR